MTGIQQIDDLFAYQKLTAAWIYLLVTKASDEAMEQLETLQRLSLKDIPWQVIEPVNEDARTRYIGKGLK